MNNKDDLMNYLKAVFQGTISFFITVFFTPFQACNMFFTSGDKYLISICSSRGIISTLE